MKFFRLVKAAEISHNEMIFLSDVSGDNRIFSVDGLPRFALGEILSIRPKNDEFRLEIKADSGFYEVGALPWHKFAIYRPDEISAKNLSIGDRVLLRGNNSIPVRVKGHMPAISCISEVLKISQNRKSELEIVFGLSEAIAVKRNLGRFRLPFLSHSKTTLRMSVSPNAKMEISHGGYA